MPAVSKAQRRAAAAELARRREGKDPEKFKSLGEDELEKFASTPERGLPKRAKPERAKPSRHQGGGTGNRFGRPI